MICKNCKTQITKGSKSGFCKSCFQIGKKKNFSRKSLLAISARAIERNTKRIGTHLSDFIKRKIGEANKISQKGKKLSEITKIKISEGLRGEKSYRWQGGITTLNNKIRTSREYKLVREACFKRDNFTCIWCGQRGGRLNADHIKPFALFPELRLALDNLRTLCELCHNKIGWRGGHIKK